MYKFSVIYKGVVKDDYIEKINHLKNEVLSGKFQRYMKSDNNVKSCVATIQVRQKNNFELNTFIKLKDFEFNDLNGFKVDKKDVDVMSKNFVSFEINIVLSDNDNNKLFHLKQNFDDTKNDDKYTEEQYVSDKIHYKLLLK
jgi:hypothetical protein